MGDDRMSETDLMEHVIGNGTFQSINQSPVKSFNCVLGKVELEKLCRRKSSEKDQGAHFAWKWNLKRLRYEEQEKGRRGMGNTDSIAAVLS